MWRTYLTPTGCERVSANYGSLTSLLAGSSRWTILALRVVYPKFPYFCDFLKKCNDYRLLIIIIIIIIMIIITSMRPSYWSDTVKNMWNYFNKSIWEPFGSWKNRLYRVNVNSHYPSFTGGHWCLPPVSETICLLYYPMEPFTRGHCSVQTRQLADN